MDRLHSAHVFVNIAQQGSLTAAADALDMSRAMVTRHLKEMEDWVGARLFHRNTRRISLTPAGEATLDHCRELLLLVEKFPSEENDTEGADLRGHLRVACSPSLARASITRAVARFLEQHPQATIDLHISEKAVNLVDERIDLAIRITNTLDDGMIARQLGECHSVVCASPAYLARHGMPVSVADLARHNCLSYVYFGKSLWSFTCNGVVENVSVSGNIKANDTMVLLDAALNHMGITLQPTYAAAPYLASGELVALLPDADPMVMGIHGIYISREHQPLILRRFLDFLVGCFVEE